MSPYETQPHVWKATFSTATARKGAYYETTHFILITPQRLIRYSCTRDEKVFRVSANGMK